MLSTRGLFAASLTCAITTLFVLVYKAAWQTDRSSCHRVQTTPSGEAQCIDDQLADVAAMFLSMGLILIPIFFYCNSEIQSHPSDTRSIRYEPAILYPEEPRVLLCPILTVAATSIPVAMSSWDHGFQIAFYLLLSGYVGVVASASLMVPRWCCDDTKGNQPHAAGQHQHMK